MRVIVPATPHGLHARTLPAILRDNYQAHVVPMLGLTSYHDLMLSLWEAGEDFALVEHDIEVRPSTLRSFEECPNLWCAFSYEVYAGDVATAYGGPFALGCSRFRAQLLTEHPECVIEAGKMDLHPVHPPRSYAVMDSTLTQWLRSIPDLKVCHHLPNVIHHHHYLREHAYTPVIPN